MKLKKTFAPLLLGAAMLLPVSATAKSLGESLPVETHVAFWIDDISEAIAAAEKNGFYRLLSDDQERSRKEGETIGDVMRRLPFSSSDPLFPLWPSLLAAIEVRLQGGLNSGSSIFNVSANDVLETFDGSLAFYSTLYDLYMQGNVDIVEWDVVLAAEYSEGNRPKVDIFLEKALSNIPQQAKRQRVEYHGHQVNRVEYYLDEVTNLGGGQSSGGVTLIKQIPVIVEYAFVENTFYMAEGRGEPLRKALRAREEGNPSQRLTSKSRYRRALDRLGDGPGAFHLYFDITHHVRELEDHPEMQRARRLASALGLTNVGPLVARASIDENGASITAMIPASGNPTGVFNILALSPENTLENLALVPEDAKLAGTLALDFRTVYEEWRAAMMIVNPRNQRMIDSAINTAESIAGINFRQGILGAAKGEMVNYIRPGAEDSLDSFDALAGSFFFPLGGSTETAETVNGILRRLNSDESRFLDLSQSDFNGATLWESPESLASSARETMHIGVLPAGIALSTNGGELRDLIRRVQQRPDRSIGDTEGFRQLRTELPAEGLRGLVYQPAESVIDLYIRQGYFGAGLDGNVEAQRQRLASYIGKTWWAISSIDGDLHFRMQLDDPSAGN